MEGRDIKKRKLGNANSNSKTLGNRADEAFKKNHKKWLKRSTILTYSILETSSEIPFVSRFNNNDDIDNFSIVNNNVSNNINKGSLVVTRSSCNILSEIMDKIECNKQVQDNNNQLMQNAEVNDDDLSDASSDLYSDIEDNNDLLKEDTKEEER